MNPRSRLLFVAGAAAIVVVLGGFATGCGHHHRDPAEMAALVKEHVNDTLDDLSATDAQRTEVHAIADRLLASAQALRQDGQPVHAELLAAWQSPNPDRARLHALVDERMDALRALAHQAVDEGLSLHDVLTPEQRAKVAKKVERLHRLHP